jgi:hypothetical protein
VKTMSEAISSDGTATTNRFARYRRSTDYRFSQAAISRPP